MYPCFSLQWVWKILLLGGWGGSQYFHPPTSCQSLCIKWVWTIDFKMPTLLKASHSKLIFRCRVWLTIITGPPPQHYLCVRTFILFMVSRSCSSWCAEDRASSLMSVSFMSLSRSCFFNSSTEEASSASYKLSKEIIILQILFTPCASSSFHSFLFSMVALLACIKSFPFS